jgi:glycosyltransferase involved in cell wall biosynthesis
MGAIPYEDMLGLMYHSIAVINPSLFEGWSTTVEESKSLGKKVLLSDIDVHLEQSPKRALFFNPNDSDELADLMHKSICALNPKEELVEKNEAENEMLLRSKSFTRTYQSIILDLLKVTKS